MNARLTMLGWGVLALSLGASGCCKKNSDDEDNKKPPAPVVKKHSAEAKEAFDAVHVLARVYQPTYSVNNAADRARRCMTLRKNIDNLVKCVDESQRRAASIARQMKAGKAEFACGQQIDAAHAKAKAAIPQWLSQVSAALKSKERVLKVGLATKSLKDYCAAKKCDWLPKETTTYAGTMASVSCTASLFDCGGATCSVTEVAQRLGLSPRASENKTGQPLKVKKDGKVIKPLR